ncbi:MAG: hypothetical protein EOM54_07160 [Clostridia bacterium]|nr:hypothetical protein [Clostridia bacterium]NCC69903.1 hypothetical protein [Clostridia bacterium]
MKKLISVIALVVILVTGIFGVTYMYNNIPITYDGSTTDVYELLQDPSNYDTSDADGIASIIVKENLELTNAVNNVTAIVFDFRGYDTMGEAFILIVSVTGALAILRKSKKRWEGD